MSIHFDKALGIHPEALALRVTRAEVLSANLANVDTPGYQAKDIDFAAQMQRANSPGLRHTTPETLYRVPYQPAADGNTVALDVEQAEFAKNAQAFHMSLTFLNMKFAGLKKAIEER
ncbi:MULTISPECIES: flagellar basal body rod protein FlgB [Mangrovibacter]|uniref:Flagellar basal body rod protein FlgB n=2 Tax=Mangrovibacter TaxID=451512 RepID=A0A1B7L3L6_9ENTR|nr:MULTISPECIES: flagellar basal body rod protein FlgB [Mangrovibacter]OAT76920.1 flagellar basal-body rod protein FlgB [Mangrovibacter phragmitis]PWW00826.1 flagellar basal-body rod protein FlgB [Mangrovibacter plantisponsor]